MKKSVYVFQCKTKPSRFGLTYDPNGNNLPKEACQGEWILHKTLNMDGSEPSLMSGLSPSEIITVLDRDGYMIVDIQIHFKEQFISGSL